MRIVYFHGATIPSRAASTIQVMKMCNAFKRAGHTVFLITPAGKDEEKNVADIWQFYGVDPLDGFFRSLSPEIRGRHYITGMDMARRARSLRADLVFARHARGALFAALLGVPVIYEAHRPLLHESPRDWRFTRILTRTAQFRFMVTISAALKEVYEADFPHLRGRILVAHDAADIPSLDNNGGQAARAEEEAGERLNVGYVGQLCPFADFHIIGGQDDAIDRLRIRAQCLDNVRIHGFLPHPDAQARMAAFDVVLAPYGRQVGALTQARADSSNYMSPLKLFEYMAAGKAIVCSDHAVLKEVVTDRETALICSREDVDEWAAALYSLHCDPALRRRLGQNARALCWRSFTWRARVDKVLGRLADAAENHVAK